MFTPEWIEEVMDKSQKAKMPLVPLAELEECQTELLLALDDADEQKELLARTLDVGEEMGKLMYHLKAQFDVAQKNFEDTQKLLVIEKELKVHYQRRYEQLHRMLQS